MRLAENIVALLITCTFGACLAGKSLFDVQGADSWYEAHDTCLSEGGILAEIMTEEDFLAVERDRVWGWVDMKRPATIYANISIDTCRQCYDKGNNSFCDDCEFIMSQFVWLRSNVNMTKTPLLTQNLTFDGLLRRYFHSGNEPSIHYNNNFEYCGGIKYVNHLGIYSFNDQYCYRDTPTICEAIDKAYVQETVNLQNLNDSVLIISGDVLFSDVVITANPASHVRIRGCPTFQNDIAIAINDAENTDSFTLMTHRDNGCSVATENITVSSDADMACIQLETGKLNVNFGSKCGKSNVRLAVILPTVIIAFLVVLAVVVIALNVPSVKKRIFPYHFREKTSDRNTGIATRVDTLDSKP